MKTKILIPLGPLDAQICIGLASERNPRIQNWRNPKPSGRVHFQIETHNLGRYSRGCRFTHYEYTPKLRSFGVALDGGKRFAGVINKQPFCLYATKGFRFSSDELGAKLERTNGKSDYHFTSDDVTERGTRWMVAQLRANEVRRRDERKAELRAKREAAIYAREIGSVRVTLADSRRAGNCVEGSLAYCESKLGISRSEVMAGAHLFSVPASRLLASNGHDGVARAVRQAWLRETAVQI